MMMSKSSKPPLPKIIKEKFESYYYENESSFSKDDSILLEYNLHGAAIEDGKFPDYKTDNSILINISEFYLMTIHSDGKPYNIHPNDNKVIIGKGSSNKAISNSFYPPQEEYTTEIDVSVYPIRKNQKAERLGKFLKECGVPAEYIKYRVEKATELGYFVLPTSESFDFATNIYLYLHQNIYDDLLQSIRDGKKPQLQSKFYFNNSYQISYDSSKKIKYDRTGEYLFLKSIESDFDEDTVGWFENVSIIENNSSQKPFDASALMKTINHPKIIKERNEAKIEAKEKEELPQKLILANLQNINRNINFIALNILIASIIIILLLIF
jgi:hypothetical protein